MQIASSFLPQGENNIYKKTVFRILPELVGHEIEADFLNELVCPQCGQEGGSALVYRQNDNDSWNRVETFKCSRCRDRELFNFYTKKSFKEQSQLISERLTNDYFLLPEKLKGSGFKDYHETNSVTTLAKQKAISYVKTFLASEQDSYNLLIQGNPGTGKTHLCVAIARTLKEKGFIVGFLTIGQLLSKIKSTYNKASMITEEKIFKDLKKLDFLILDDLGAEATGGNDDWRKSLIFEIVESRSGKPTIYTSNLTDQDLPMAVGERVFSRLYDNTKFIDLFTDDYRKRLQIK
ncbi:ATP-binding protein [Peribacillus frigoritolerans]|uniref:ATP-binding protein n=1 Tax=Peribacillus frigoritolerans TaxID=450367 RepID=UPI003806F0C9